MSSGKRLHTGTASLSLLSLLSPFPHSTFAAVTLARVLFLLSHCVLHLFFFFSLCRIGNAMNLLVSVFLVSVSVVPHLQGISAQIVPLGTCSG